MVKTKSEGRGAILICAKAYPPDVGGVQTYTEFVARAYVKAGFEPIVVSQFEGAAGWHERRYPEGAVNILNVGLGSQPVVFARMLLANFKLMRQRTFAFLHPTTWRPALAMTPWRGRLPLVLTVHGREVLSYPKALGVLMRGALRDADLVVAVSRPTLAVAEAVLAPRAPKGRWMAAHNGLSYLEEARAFTPAGGDPNRRVIYSFCRLAERKNIDGALRALRKLVDQGVDNFHYVVGGGGPMRAELEALIDDLRLRPWVTMLGYVEEAEIPRLYQEADIFLHPQTAPEGGKDIEGFGLAIADAMSYGAVCVVGEAGGPADFVADGENGRVVDGENVDAIAEALKALLTNADEMDRLSAAGRAWALRNLAWDGHVAKIIDALEDMRKI